MNKWRTILAHITISVVMFATGLLDVFHVAHGQTQAETSSPVVAPSVGETLKETASDWCGPACGIYANASDLADIASTIANFLRNMRQSDRDKMDDAILGACGSAYACSTAAIDETADTISQTGPFTKIENIKSLFQSLPMSNTDRIAYLKPFVIVRARQLHDSLRSRSPSNLASQSPSESQTVNAHIFDGSYVSPDFRGSAGPYGFQIDGTEGKAILSNSATYKIGDVILKFNATGPNTFSGTQICTDGNFYPVTGALSSDGSLEISIVGCVPPRWRMTRTTGGPAASR
jgi:hypothetical protein